MTQEERIAAVERTVKNQFYSIIVQAVERHGPIVATREQLYRSFMLYVEHADVVTGEPADYLVTEEAYWEVVKRLADPKLLTVSENEVRIPDDFDYDVYWKN